MRETERGCSVFLFAVIAVRAVGNGGEGGILTQPLLLFCHAFSNLQKTGINIDDLTHSMASDVSTVANNWDGFWPSTDTKDTKAAVDQNSTRYLPCDSLEQGYAVERSFARSYTPQTWQVQPRECQQTHSRKQKAQKAQRCCRETVWRNDKMSHTSGGSEIPCQFISI